MPLTNVFLDSLEAALGEKVTEESFDELCFEFGLELDDVTSDFEMAKKERGEAAAIAEGRSKRIIYKVDCPANRYDVLCLEGLVRALKIFKGQVPPPVYSLQPPKPRMTMTVHASTAQIRPFAVAAVLRGVTFDADRYQSFIDLQDKLHQNICRKRTLVAIGTHDLDTLKPPFRYQALPPKDISFVPLGQSEKMDGNRMMEVLSTHLQLKNYLPIIRDSPVYPVIQDANDVVLSVPPIINGEHSKIRLETKDVFIECTATDHTKANITLNTVCAMFAEYTAKPFEIEPVEVVYADDYPANSFTKPKDRIIYPKIDARPMTANIDRMKNALGLQKLTSDEVRDLFIKMCVPCEVDKKDRQQLNCQIPITRSDIMHECDLIEDLAIAYGYNNLDTAVPGAGKGAAEQPVNHITDLVRQELADAGLNECYNWALISNKENTTNLRREVAKGDPNRVVENPHFFDVFVPPVTISNPKTVEFEILRTSLLPCVLKTVHSNKGHQLPIRVFEVADVVVPEPTREVGCKNVRRVCVVHVNHTAQFEVTHGVLDQLMYALNCVPAHEQRMQHKRDMKKKPFTLVPSDDPAFFPGRQAHIVCEGIQIGIIGEIHPDVMSNKGFEIGMPASAFEMNIEPFMEWMSM